MPDLKATFQEEVRRLVRKELKAASAVTRTFETCPIGPPQKSFFNISFLIRALPAHSNSSARIGQVSAILAFGAAV